MIITYFISNKSDILFAVHGVNLLSPCETHKITPILNKICYFFFKWINDGKIYKKSGQHWIFGLQIAILTLSSLQKYKIMEITYVLTNRF